MTVTLLHHTPLWVASTAIRTCWQSQDKSDTVDGICGPSDLALIDRVGNKFKHASTLEHVSYNFYIEGISRACLQELARHRMASLSVKSSRYTLKELKDTEDLFVLYDLANQQKDTSLYDTDYWKICSQFIISSENELVDWSSCTSLMRLQGMLNKGISNDRAKYCMPESYKTSLTWSINIRSLQNFISLRSDKAALWEIRNLANELYRQLPEDHKYLFNDHLKDQQCHYLLS